MLVRENTATAVVAASLIVRMGSRWETEDDAGISHLLQQVLLKGTEKRSALEVAETAESLGGGIGASADLDYSEIRATALARNWRTMLELIADVALRPSLPVSEIDGERRATLTALRSRQDQPFSLAMDTLMSRVYGDHPYGRPILGRPAALERIDRARLLAHHQRFYRAPRMILAVSGDVDPRLVMAEAARLFADAPTGPAAAEPDATRGRRARGPHRDRAGVGPGAGAGRISRPAHVARRLRGGQGAGHRAGRRHGRTALHRGARQAGPGLLDGRAPIHRARGPASSSRSSAPRRPTRPGRRPRCWGSSSASAASP